MNIKGIEAQKEKNKEELEDQISEDSIWSSENQNGPDHNTVTFQCLTFR